MTVERLDNESSKNTGTYRRRPSLVPPLEADTSGESQPETIDTADISEEKQTTAHPMRRSTETRKLKRVR